MVWGEGKGRGRRGEGALGLIHKIKKRFIKKIQKEKRTEGKEIMTALKSGKQII